MTSLSVVIRVLFAVDERWPNAVTGVTFERGVLTVTSNTEIGTITMTFAEEDFNYRLTNVSLTPKGKDLEQQT